MTKKREKLGFKQAFEYLLDFLCFAYYVKDNNLVSDSTFDEIESLYKKMFNESYAPMRGIERECIYTNGVQVVYDLLITEKERGKNENP